MFRLKAIVPPEGGNYGKREFGNWALIGSCGIGSLGVDSITLQIAPNKLQQSEGDDRNGVGTQRAAAERDRNVTGADGGVDLGLAPASLGADEQRRRGGTIAAERRERMSFGRR